MAAEILFVSSRMAKNMTCKLHTIPEARARVTKELAFANLVKSCGTYLATPTHSCKLSSLMQMIIRRMKTVNLNKRSQTG